MTILELMKRRWDAADEAEFLTLQTVALALRLATAQRAARDTAGTLSDALAKESSARLCTILRMEAAARLKAPKEKDVSLPRRKARKG